MSINPSKYVIKPKHTHGYWLGASKRIKCMQSILSKPFFSHSFGPDRVVQCNHCVADFVHQESLTCTKQVRFTKDLTEMCIVVCVCNHVWKRSASEKLHTRNEQERKKNERNERKKHLKMLSKTKLIKIYFKCYRSVRCVCISHPPFFMCAFLFILADFFSGRTRCGFILSLKHGKKLAVLFSLSLTFQRSAAVRMWSLPFKLILFFIFLFIIASLWSRLVMQFPFTYYKYQQMAEQTKQNRQTERKSRKKAKYQQRKKKILEQFGLKVKRHVKEFSVPFFFLLSTILLIKCEIHTRELSDSNALSSKTIKLMLWFQFRQMEKIVHHLPFKYFLTISLITDKKHKSQRRSKRIFMNLSDPIFGANKCKTMGSMGS